MTIEKTQNNLVDKARYELKFVADHSVYDMLHQWVHNHEQCFIQEYPDRKVNNIYFDNHDLDSYSENLSGISSRTKIRLRWYGDTRNTQIKSANLELKIRNNKMGWKHSEPILFKKNLLDLSKAEIIQTITEQLSDDLKNRFNFSNVPILINSYERNYYVSSDKKLRVTLDRNLLFYDQRLGSKINLNSLFHPANIVVTEFKCAANDLDSCQRAVEKIFIHPSKCSKYVLGVQTILGV